MCLKQWAHHETRGAESELAVSNRVPFLLFVVVVVLCHFLAG